MELPSYLFASVQMPVFFFLSGALWNERKEFTPLLYSKLHTLLVPAICFTLLAFILVGCRGDKNFVSASFLMKLDMAQKGSITWFLVALFLFNMIQYVIDKYRLKRYYWGWVVLAYPLGSYLYARGYYTIVPLFPLAHILVFQIYFVLGVYIGRLTLKMVESPLINRENILISCIITIVLIHLIPWQNGFFKYVSFYIYIFLYTLAFIFVFLYLCKRVEQYKVMRVFNYFGVNSIVVYLTHWPLWIYVLHPCIGTHFDRYIAYIIMVICMTIIIQIINRCIPFVIGK